MRVARLDQPLLGQPALGIQGSHAAGAGRGDRLAVVAVRDIAGGEDSFDRRVGALRRRPAT